MTNDHSGIQRIGTALKSIIARFQEMKENPLGDLEDGMSVNRVETALKTVGVALRDTSGEFRDLDDVFADLGSRWGGLSRNQRAYIATLAAGARQQSRFMAIMTDYDRTLQLTRVSTNSAGEANRQFAIYSDSLEAAQNRLTNSFEAFYAALLSSDLLKGLMSSFSNLINIITTLNPLVVALGLGLVVATSKMISFVVATSSSIVALLMKNATLSKVITKLGTYAVAQGTATAATAATAGATMALQASFVLLLAAVAGLIAGVIWLTKVEERAQKKRLEAAQLASEEAQAAKEQATSLEQQIDRYTELSRKLNKTKQEQSEYLDLIKQISAESPNLVDGIDAEGNAILKRSSALERELALRRQIAADKAIEESDKKRVVYAEAAWDATYETGAIGERTAEQAEVIREAKDNLANELDSFSAEAYGSLGKAEKYLKGEMTREEAYGAALSQFGPDQYSPETAQKFKNNLDKFFKEVDLYYETRAAETRAFYTKDLAMRGQTALDEMEILNPNTVSLATRELVGGFAKSSVDIAAAMEGFDDLTESQKIEKFADDTFKSMMEASEQLQRIPGFDKELEKLFRLKSDGATGKELIEALEAFKTNFSDFAEDRGMQESFENIYNSLSGQIINPEGIRSDVAVIGQIYKAALTEEGKKINSEKIDYMPRGDFDTSILESDLEKVLTPLSEAMQMEIMDSLDAIDETAIKAKFIDLIPEMFNMDGEYYPLVQNILENTDKDDPVAIMAAKKQIETLIREIEPTFGDADISSITDGLIRAEIGVEDFLKKAKEAYTQIQELQKAVAESASGLDFGQAQEMMALYGANAVEQVGEVFYLTGAAIEHQRQVLMGELEKTMTGNLDAIDSEINIAKQTIKEIESLKRDQTKPEQESLEIAKEMLVVKNNEKEVYEEIYSKMQQISAAELARMQNQNVLTGINAITATAGSLQEIADLYSRVNEGAMTQLDIMNAIAQNPDYLQFLEVQGNKIGFNISAIEAETKSKIESMKSTIDLRKAAIEATIAELETIAEIEESSIASDETRMESANERGEQAVLALQGLTNAEIESFDTIANLYADESTLVSDLDKAKETAYQNEIARIRSLTEGYHQKNIAESGGIADLSKIKTETGSKVGEIDPSGLGKEKTGDWLSRFAEGLGIKTEDISRAEQARESIGVLRAELVKLDAIGAQLDTWTPQDFLEKIVPSKDKSDSAKEAMEEIYDWFFLIFDQFYNLNRVVDQYQRKIDKIDLALEFNSTSGDRSNALTKEKTALIGKQVSATAELIKRQAESLDLARKDMSQFTDFVKFSGDEIEVRWDRINAIKVTSEEEKIWYDTLLNSIDAYVEVKDAMDESTKALMQYQAALEEVYNSLMNVVIETRQSILDAIIEKENAEISFAKEKYDKLTEMEQKYLSAIKKSISEERKLRDRSRKEEDLAQKERRLSILQRDTSGLYSAEAVELSQEIETDRENLRNAQVDAQLELLEKQYAVQQEQRNLEISAMEQRMDWRLENGLYWETVDQTIANGSDAIVGLLQSTDDYMRADPLDQERMDLAFQNNATQIVDIFRSGSALVQDLSVVDALRTGIRDISNGPLLGGLEILNQTMLDSDPTVPMVNKLDEVKGEIHGLGKIFDSSVETFKANTISAIDRVSKDFASQINSLNNKLNKQQASAASGSGGTGGTGGTGGKTGNTPPSSSSGSKEASLQHFLNANAKLWGGARLEADGKLGPKTKAEIDKMFGYLRSKVFSEMSGASLSQNLNPLNKAQSSKEINSLVNNLLKRFTGNGLPFGLPLKYKEGGLADYTGPAWVDGTKSKPEAFLNPNQTKLIANLRDVLEKGAMQTPTVATNSSSVNTGDINVYLANRAGASANEIGEAVQREILKSFENRASLGIRKMR